MRHLFAVVLLWIGCWPADWCAAQTLPSDAVQVTLSTAPLPDTPGYHVLHGTARIHDKSVPIATGVFLPRAWFDSKGPLPLVVTLHNRGQNGTDGYSLCFEGLGMIMTSDHGDNRRTGELPPHPIRLRTDAQFVGIAPQCPVGYAWESPEMTPMVDQIIRQICSGFHLDRERVCLTGFSYGASSTWAISMAMPDRFSAIAPIAGRQTKDPKHDVLKLNGLPVYLSIGSVDQSIPNETQHMRDALVAAGHEPLMFKLIAGGNHFAYEDLYEDPDFWNWMLSQRIGHPTTQPTLATTYPVYPPLAPVQTQAPAQHDRGILGQVWRDISGKYLSALESDASYPNFPSDQRVLPTMQIPRNQPGVFGTKLTGWVLPPATGDYTFYIASQEQGELSLSPDDQPEHAVKIASVTHWSWPDDWMQTSQQQSAPVHLMAGSRYAITAVEKCGGGDNHLSIAWKLPDGSMEGPIATEHLQPATPARVPGPEIVDMSLPAVPRDPGTHHLVVTVSYRAHRKPVAVLLQIPRAIASEPQLPAIIYCPDPTQRDPRGFPPTTGPMDALGAPGLADWSPFVVIEPQAPADMSWDTPATSRAVALVVDRLLQGLPVQSSRLYLTGSNAGGTDAWHLALRLPNRFAAIAPINAMEVNPGNLASQLSGTEVHIITGVRNGVATDCANRMKSHLAQLNPAADVMYEMKGGDEIAGQYYAKRDFYDWMLSWHRPSPKAAATQAASTQP